MNIKNYTSTVSPETTIGNIERILASAGASSIAKDFEGGNVSALFFQLKNPAGGPPIPVKLPINHEAVFLVMKKNMKRFDPSKANRIREQAMRTSWRLMQDWLEVQLSLVQMNQVELLQVFLPFVWMGTQNFYSLTKAKGLLGLPAPKDHDNER